jgi:hypothetical protein
VLPVVSRTIELISSHNWPQASLHCRPKPEPAKDVTGKEALQFIPPHPGAPFDLLVQRTHCSTSSPPGSCQPQPLLTTCPGSFVFHRQFIELCMAVHRDARLYGLGETIQGEGRLELVRDGRTITRESPSWEVCQKACAQKRAYSACAAGVVPSIVRQLAGQLHEY